jgi:hypothetical protein
MRVEQRLRARQRARLPPRVVVAERDVRSVHRAHAERAAGRAAVALERDQPHRGEALAHELGRAVARGLVDDDDLRALGQRGEPPQRVQQLARAVARDHDDRDAAGQRLTSTENVESWPLSPMPWAYPVPASSHS